MSSESETPKGQPGEVEEVSIRIPFPETFTYVNCAAFAISQMEIRVGFAEATQDHKAISKVGIILPPEAAAVIALVLYQQVKLYEEKFGEVRHPLWKAMKAGAQDSMPDSVPPRVAG